MIFFQKPKTPEHKYVIYKKSDDGTIADKDEDGDIVLYTEQEVGELMIEFAQENLHTEIKHQYAERFQVVHSVVDGSTRTFGMTPKQR